MHDIYQIIALEEEKLSKVSNAGEGLNILYNLMILKNKNGDKEGNYKGFKKFIDYYIEVVKLSDYGYDKLNHSKIENLLQLLNYEEQISALNYAISVSARELPEHDKNWFIERKHSAEVNHIFACHHYKLYFKAVMLFCANSLHRLFLVILIFFILVITILLPAFNENLILFNITYDNYSSCFFLNHILNVISHFADLDNDFEINPLNWIGVLLLIVGKLFFILIVVNFVYRKISDKINIK
jgi:hypothetical protein